MTATNPSRRSQMLRTTVVFPEPLPPATPMMTGRFMLRFLPDGVLFGYAPSIVAILSGDCKMAGEGGPHGSCWQRFGCPRAAGRISLTKSPSRRGARVLGEEAERRRC